MPVKAVHLISSYFFRRKGWLDLRKNGFQSWAWKVCWDLQLYPDQKNNEADLELHFWEAPTRKDGGKMQMIKDALVMDMF